MQYWTKDLYLTNSPHVVCSVISQNIEDSFSNYGQTNWACPVSVFIFCNIQGDQIYNSKLFEGWQQ
jgi:hypothetical protein